MNKLIYVSAEHHGEYPNISISTPKELSALLDDGWVINKTKREKVVVAEGGKKISVERYDLEKVEERGLSTGKQRDEERGSRALGFHESPNRSVIPGQNDESYLGRSSAGIIPGVRAISASMGDMAYGMGVDGAKAGAAETDCSRFPPGSKPWADWLQGFWKAEGKPSADARAAMKEGGKAAKGPEDAEVTCPYTAEQVEYQAWLYGFKLGGGRVEAKPL